MVPLKTKKLTIKHLAIDIHAHGRDEKEARKGTIVGLLDLASKQGVGMVFDMPNNQRPVDSEERVKERLALVPEKYRNCYRLYVGLTGYLPQVKDAVRCYRDIPEVIGFKMFVCGGIGNLSVTNEMVQQEVYRELSRLEYKGVLAVHCEKKSCMDSNLYSAAVPSTHCLARPEIAEVESVADQIKFALEENFQGHLHICHVSTPESVRKIDEARKMGLRISCGVTPHHIMWDDSKMWLPWGGIFKMNPPLRKADSVLKLREQLVNKMIDVIETDHAPHSSEEKRFPQCLSGYPSLNLYREFTTEFLPKLGLSEDDIKMLTYGNVLKIFEDKSSSLN